MLNLSEYQKPACRLADYLPWALLVAPGVVLNKDGSFQRTFQYRGPDLNSSTPEELVGVCARINNILRRFGSGWALFFEASRRPATDYPKSQWRSAVPWLIDQERRGMFEETGAHFESDYFLTCLYLPPADSATRAEQLLLTTPDDHQQPSYKDHLARFLNETTQALDLLSSIMPEARALGDDETLTYLHSTISPKRHRVAAPKLPAYLDAILADADLAGGLEPRLGAHALRTISVLGFPNATEPGLLDELNRLGFDYRWSTRFIPMDKTDAVKVLGRYRRQWFAKRKSIAAVIKEVMFNQDAVLVDTDADNKAADADGALQELGGDDVSFGFATTSVTILDEDTQVANQKLRELERVINGRGFVTIRESVNAVDAWLGALPGNAYANVRQPIIHTLNLAHMTPMSAVWAGPTKNNHLNAPPLLYATTDGSTPFRLVTHQGDVGHTIVVGPTGAGKSVLLSLIVMQFQRYAGAQVYIFDKDRSAFATTLGLSGDFYNLGADADLGFQPLKALDIEAERVWATEWILGLLSHENVEVTPDVKEAVWSALSNLSQAPIAERTITGLVALLQSNTLRQALGPYTLDGPYGRLLDADAEGFDLSDIICFEMNALLEEKGLILPVLTYLFHRLEARFDGRPTLLVLDEAWVFLDHPLFASRIREWLKTLRKKNVSVIFSTQSLADIATSSIAPAIIESCPSRVFLANDKATERQMRRAYEDFGLNARQIEIIARATPKRDYYFQSRAGSRLFDLGLGPAALAFCGASSKSELKRVEEIYAAHGRERFASNYLRACNLDWAADLIDRFNDEQGERKCA